MPSPAPVKQPPISVVIAGDAAIDWYEERILHYPDDKDREAGGLPPQNWRLRPGCDWHRSSGGVLLLHEMINYAGTKRKGDDAQFCEPHLEIKAHPKIESTSGKVPTSPSEQLIHSLAVIYPDSEQHPRKDPGQNRTGSENHKVTDQSWRAREFLGYRRPDAYSKSVYLDQNAGARPDLVVLDDAGNGFRDDRKNWPNWLKNLQKRKPRLVVLKLNEPLPETLRGKNELWDHLKAARVPLLIIVNGYDLRRENIDLSWRLSWERTAHDIARATRPPNALATLTKFGNVVIRLGVEGAAIVPRGTHRQIHLVCDAARIEDGGEGIAPGHVTGLTSAFVTGIICSLASSLRSFKSLVP
jgi:hypothetical protein